jgi:hypothetical protein
MAYKRSRAPVQMATEKKKDLAVSNGVWQSHAIERFVEFVVRGLKTRCDG